MLFVPDSYIEQYGKRILTLEPPQKFEHIEIRNSYMKYINNDWQLVEQIVNFYRNGTAEIIQAEGKKEINIGSERIEAFFCKLYKFLDRGGFVIDNSGKIGGYSSDVRIFTDDSKEINIPGGLVFKGNPEQYFESFVQYEMELMIFEDYEDLE